MAKDEDKSKEGTKPPEGADTPESKTQAGGGKKPPESPPKKPKKGARMPESKTQRFQAKNVGTVVDIKRNGMGEERTYTYKETLEELEKLLEEKQ